MTTYNFLRLEKSLLNWLVVFTTRKQGKTLNISKLISVMSDMYALTAIERRTETGGFYHHAKESIITAFDAYLGQIFLVFD